MNRLCFRRLTVCAALLGFMLCGRGPLLLPMSMPLDEESQRMIDGAWNNMLTPVNRVDHQTLLDTIVTYWLFQLGVDRLHMVSEKYLSSGKVVMEIDCDRADPSADQFTVTVVDDRGKTLRRERYSRDDVNQSAAALAEYNRSAQRSGVTIITQPATQPAAEPGGREESAEQRQHRIEYERRLKAVVAATQPATLRP